MKSLLSVLIVVPLLLAGCASDWKIHGGPADCVKMCEAWGLEFTAMVGVGNQDRMGHGATACVCQPKPPNQNASIDGAGSTSTSLAAPITAIEAAAAQAAYMAQNQQQTQQYSQQYNTGVYRY